MLRRSICTILCLALILTMTGAFAREASGTVLYEIPELGVSLSIPAHMDVFTRSTPEDSALFEEYDLTPASLADEMESDDIYLIAYEPFTGAKIEVCYIYSPFESFDNMSSELIDEFIGSTVASFESSGLDVDFELTEVGSYTFLKMQMGFSFMPDYKAIAYMTAQNHVGIEITLYPGTALTEADKVYVNSIAASLVFLDTPADDIIETETVSITPEQAAAGIDPDRVYHDPVTNISFNLHSNWEQGVLSESSDTMSAKFEPKDDGYAMLGYAGLYVSPITLTEEECCEMFSLPADAVETRTFAGYEFFVLTIDAANAAELMGIPIDLTIYISICESNLIMFSFAGSEPGSAYITEVEAMLNTITFK